MSTFIVPSLREKAWPTLGPQVCDFIEEALVFGPGDLRGEPAEIDDETRGLIYRMYEVFPKGHKLAGRRRFKRCALSLRKGTAKTEKSVWITAAELHHEGPVRCDGFDARGKPVGRPVTDPYIPMIAVTEEQTEELAYNALYTILSECPLVDDFDITLDRTTRSDGTGRAVPLAGAPGPRDGALTSFQPFDETHRLVLPRAIEAHTTMLNNIPKRRGADAWTLETTTAFAPGQGSIAEDTWHYAKEVEKGRIKDSRLFFFHRQAGDKAKLTTKKGLRAALREASGPAAAWSDIDSILALREDPKVDLAYWERVWLNRPTQDARQAFSTARWDELTERRQPTKGSAIAIGVDGARFRDALGIVGTELETGFQFLIGVWERPPKARADYEHPFDEIDQEMVDAFELFEVVKVYIDPQWIDKLVTTWAARWGDRIVTWETHRQRPAARMLGNYKAAMKGGDLKNDGDPIFRAHIGNARRRNLRIRDDEDKPLWVIEKERPDSPLKIDLAMAGALSWEARGDALEHGEGETPSDLLMYDGISFV